MPSQKDNPNRSQAFGRLLSGAINSIATYEGRTAPVVEDELGQLLHLSGKTIQRYKAGHLPPDHEMVKVLADAAVRRGFLDREWLQRFLHAARYPFANTLLDQLRPIGPARPRPPRVYENLPAPTYSQFVMRAEAFAEVIDGLELHSAVVLIASLGGMGKTSLALEIASRCHRGDFRIPHFDAVVWVSDKDRPGTTTHNIVLDHIAVTLDYRGITQLGYDEKRYEVEQLIRRQRILLVVDNFETVTDGALLAWLLRLPEPSKALITTREFRREFWNSAITVELRGMTDDEARALIAERLRVLRIEKLVSDSAHLDPLLVATGGNPKAIELALGLVKHEHRPIQQVVDHLYTARGELFNDLFSRAWTLLDEDAQRVLLVAPFFVNSVSAEALSSVAGIPSFTFDRALERLTDLALLDVHQGDILSDPRYAIHPLTRAFATARLEGKLDFEAEARERWIARYLKLVSSIGHTWNDLSKLRAIDHERDTVLSVIDWTREKSQHARTCQIIRDAGYYFYVRGDWNKLLTTLNMLVEAATQVPDVKAEIEGLVFAISVLSEQGKLAELPSFLERLQQRVQSITPLPKDLSAEVLHANAMSHLAFGEIESAGLAWQQSLEIVASFTNNKAARNRHWLAVCYRKLGRYDESRSVLQEALDLAVKRNWERGLVSIYIEMTNLALSQKDLTTATQALNDGDAVLNEDGDSRSVGLLRYAWGRRSILANDIVAARTALVDAIDLFERMGMRRELAEARAELASLDDRERAALPR